MTTEQGPTNPTHVSFRSTIRPDNIGQPNFTDYVRNLGDAQRVAELDQLDALNKTLSAMPPELRNVVLSGILRIASTILGNEQIVTDDDIQINGERAKVYKEIFGELTEDRVFDPTFREKVLATSEE